MDALYAYALALLVKAALRCGVIRRRYLRARASFVRLQAIRKGVAICRAYRRCVGAAKGIRHSIAGWLQWRHYMRLRRAVATVKASFLSKRASERYMRLRVGLSSLVALLVGYGVRARCSLREVAAEAIQRAARAFLKRTRLFWARVRGALLLQVCWSTRKT